MTVHLCFHGVGRCAAEREPGEARYWVTEDIFLRVLDMVADASHVELSFDDGNISDAEVVLPALRERGMHAMFFALAGRLHDPASLGVAELRELTEAGMRIGSHGWAHVPWRGLSAADEKREWNDSRRALQEASGSIVAAAACPLGRYDRSTLHGAKKAGYRVLYTSDRFPSRPGAWLQARYSVTSDDTVESVMDIVHNRPRLREARNQAVSALKRLR